MRRILEVRGYNLRPGTRGEFHRLMAEVAAPMLESWKVDVVAYGPSPQDENSYFLMRTYAGLEDRKESQSRFYGSDDWKKGPRDAVLACIESYTSIVIEVDETTLQGLRRAQVSAKAT